MSQLQQRFGQLIAIIFAGWWLTSVINGLLPQLQIMLLGGRVIIPVWFMRALLLLAVLVYGIRGRFRLFPTSVAFWWVIFCVYLFLELLLQNMFNELTFGYLVQGMYQYYFLLLLVVFCHHLSGSISDRWMTPLIILSFIPLGVLGVSQLLLYDPIVPVSSVDGYFQVIAWQHWKYTGIRAFSLFRSSTEFGHFAALVGGLVIALWLRRGQVVPVKTLFVMLMLVLVLAAVYSSKARIAYLVAVATLLATIWIAPRRQVVPSMLLLPLAFAFLAYFVSVAAPQIVTAMGYRLEGMIFSDASLQYRWDAWSQFTNAWLGNGWFTALFGSGLVQGQGGEFGSAGSILIDNVFIAIGYQIGIVGLVLWLIIIWKLWRYVLAEAIRRKTALSLGIAAYWSTLPMSLMFSSAQPLYILPLILFFFESDQSPLEDSECPEDIQGELANSQA